MGISIMAHLETLGVGNSAAIISIGAVKFDADTILDRFHVGVDPASSEYAGLKISASTVLWWLDPARHEAYAQWCLLEKVALADALVGFAQWVGSDEFPLWGNGATFDNVILRSAYAACGLEPPWSFWSDRCYRTVKNLAPSVKLERIGTHHSAVDDAESQARHLQALAHTLGFAL